MKRIALLLSVVCLAASAQSPPSTGSVISTLLILDDSQYVGQPCTLYAQNLQNPLTGHIIGCLNIGGNFKISVIGSYAVMNTGSGGSPAWGLITGTLSNQADLQAALNAKQNLLTLPLSVANGGTGTSSPSLLPGTNVTITGSWPNQTVNSTASGTGTVTHTVGALTSGQLIIGNGAADVKVGDLSGDVSTSGTTTATLAAVGSSGSCGDTTHSCGITVDTKGRVTAHTNNAITGGTSFQSAGVLASRPATCTAGSGVYQYFATDQPLGQQWYYCSATNAWTQFLLLGSSALQFTAGALDINLGIIPRITNFSDIAVGWRFKAGMDLLEQSNCASAGTVPSAGNLHFCADTNDNLYQVNSAGTATQLSGGGGSKTWVKASTSAGTIASGSTDVPWNTNDSSNTGSGVTHSTSVNPERFTAATAGYYHGYCSIAGGGFSGSALIVSVIYNNGTDHAVTSPLVGTTADGGMTAPFSLHMAVGDYVKCNTNSTSSITVTSDATNFVIEN
jgi:hypothetical protein